MSRFYKQDIQGKHWVPRKSSLPTWQSGDEGKFLYDRNTKAIYFGDDTEFVNAGQYNDVPLNTILLIESAVVIVGYTLLADQDDLMGYITQGPGGANGVGSDNFGTWTFPVHTHPIPVHDHNLSAHDHTIPIGGTNHQHSFSGTAPASPSDQAKGDSSNNSAHRDHTHSYSGNTLSAGQHNHFSPTGTSSGTTGTGASDPSGNNPALTTWRPSGLNFTRQQRI